MWLVMAYDTRIAISALGLCGASAGLTEFIMKNLRPKEWWIL